MKSLLELPSKEFVDFLTNDVKDFQQVNKLKCTFWVRGENGHLVACFGNVYVMPTEICLDYQPITLGQDIGQGEEGSLKKVFKRDDTKSTAQSTLQRIQIKELERLIHILSYHKSPSKVVISDKIEFLDYANEILEGSFRYGGYTFIRHNEVQGIAILHCPFSNMDLSLGEIFYLHDEILKLRKKTGLVIPIGGSGEVTGYEYIK